MTEKTQAPVSVVEAKMARIEELSRQIARSAADLETFWHNLSDRLAAVAVEAWADEFLEGSIRLTFPNPDPAKKPRDEPEDEHGLQLGFYNFGDPELGSTSTPSWQFAVRPAVLVHGATLYSTLDHPEPRGEARPLEGEPSWLKLAALHQVPDLLNTIVGAQNDTLAVVRCALGESLEAHALVTSPFSRTEPQGDSTTVAPQARAKSASGR